jgi:subtilisin-like proprotein convertase family protein
MLTSLSAARRSLRTFGPFLLFAPLALSASVALGAKPEPGRVKVMAKTARPDSLRAVEAISGAEVIADRGSYKVFSVPADSPAARGVLNDVFARDDFDRIELRRGVQDSRQPEPARAPGFAGSTAERRLKLVQFPAPPTDDEIAKLMEAGVQIVHYIPQNAFIVWTETPDSARRASDLFQSGLLQHFGDYRVEHAVSPLLDASLASRELVEVTVQLHNFGKLANGRTVRDDMADALALAPEVIQAPYEVLGGRYLNAKLRVPGDQILKLAEIPSAVNVEPYFPKVLLGERQGQILAGNWNAGQTGPSGPGYLAWLASKGFSTDPADYPVVVVVDDGVDNGGNNPANAEFRVQANPAGASRLTFGTLPPGSAASGPEGPDGHGNINTSIVMGYNNASGASVEDATGYNYGLGISPHGRAANCRIFVPDFDPGTSFTELERHNYTQGARISTNSWGSSSFFGGGIYTADSQEYDGIVRDALPAAGGNQEMLIVFAAGNSGPGAATTSDPGTAKNIICAGASETSNPAASSGDGCDLTVGDGDNLQHMASFSSRGPCEDGRVKPDIVAPGTFIHGAASQPTFHGSGVCGASGNDFAAPGTDALFPAGSAYTWSSGTSHSTPAIAGASQLVAEYLSRVYGFDPLEDASANSPSPALLKAYVLHSGRHIGGPGATENLPGNNQGYGIVDLGFAFDSTAPRFFVDQTVVFDNPGDQRGFFGTIADPSKPFRAALVWTDAPGSTGGSAFVNDLNLTVGGPSGTYLGNNFTTGLSQTGGSPDSANNAECVFLPAGESGSISVLVEAITLGGDGLPGSGDGSDQDFALVLYNFIETPTPFFEKNGAQLYTDLGGNCNGDGMIDPGENNIAITVGLRNGGTGAASNIVATLSAISSTVSVATAGATYPNLAIGATASNAAPFVIAVSPSHACGAPIVLALEISSSEGSNTVSFSLPTGTPPTLSTQSDNPGTAINDNATVMTTLTYPDSGLIQDLNVRVNIAHSFTGDIDFSLQSPAGTTVQLFNRRGSGNDNLPNITFDDEAAQSIDSAPTPYTGSYRPEQPLSAFDGQDFNGVWTLTVTDSAGGDTGTIQLFALDAETSSAGCATPSVSLELFQIDYDDNRPGNDINGYIDPGEEIALTLGVRNAGVADATNANATLAPRNGLTTILNGTSPYALPGGGSQTNVSPLVVRLSSIASCGGTMALTLNVSTDQGMFILPFDALIGEIGGGVFNLASIDVPKPIADNSTSISAINVAAPAGSLVVDVNVVGLNITHTYDGDLDITLQSPSGAMVELSTDNGNGAANFTNTTFDDEASGSIVDGSAPFTGSFRPEGSLSDFDGEEAAGTWTLRVADDASGDFGTLTGWSLVIDAQSFSCSIVPVELSAFGLE